jgi:hypothetical protein
VGVLLAGLRQGAPLLEHTVSVPQDAKPVPFCQYAGKALLRKIEEFFK